MSGALGVSSRRGEQAMGRLGASSCKSRSSSENSKARRRDRENKRGELSVSFRRAEGGASSLPDGDSYLAQFETNNKLFLIS